MIAVHRLVDMIEYAKIHSYGLELYNITILFKLVELHALLSCLLF